MRVAIIDRFWARVNKHTASGCWLWTAATVRGYGRISGMVDGKRRPVYAHRVSWELKHGPIANGLSVLHHCDVPLCVNPDHLFLGTQAENLTDARNKGRVDWTRPRTRILTYADRLAIFHAKPYRGVVIDLARQYGVTKTCISLTRKGRFAGSPKYPLKPSSSRPQQPQRDVHPMDRVFERVPFEIGPALDLRGEVA